ncbi:MAG: class I SAM-dependent methyltransferase [Planctomycetes bacterium]|nr:class I SAM-dependent methyltransferase [Planctomycetota bacterium]
MKTSELLLDISIDLHWERITAFNLRMQPIKTFEEYRQREIEWLNNCLDKISSEPLTTSILDCTANIDETVIPYDILDVLPDKVEGFREFLGEAQRERYRRGLAHVINVGIPYLQTVENEGLGRPKDDYVGNLRLVFKNPELRKTFFELLVNLVDPTTWEHRNSVLDIYINEVLGERVFSLSDVGCSAGVTVERTQRAFPKCTVIGIDRAFPREFDSEGRIAIYGQHDIVSGPLPFAKQDVIRCSNVLFHMTATSIKKAVVNMCRSLKVGGLLLLGELETREHFPNIEVPFTAPIVDPTGNIYYRGHFVFELTDDGLRLFDFVYAKEGESIDPVHLQYVYRDSISAWRDGLGR